MTLPLKVPKETSVQVRSKWARWLPRSLERQLMLLTAACVSVSVLAYGAYAAHQQTAAARETLTAQMSALAQNLATVSAQALISSDFASIESLSLQTAAVPGILSVLVTDSHGKPVSDVVNHAGQWSPRFSTVKVELPQSNGPVSQPRVDTGLIPARDDEVMAAWHPVVAGTTLGWVRVSYRLDVFDATARAIWLQALLFIAMALAASLLLLKRLLRGPIDALQNATQFAGELDQVQGTRLSVSGQAAEVEALGRAMNVVSQRLFRQHTELANQKFALDQHAIVSITDLEGCITYANERFCEISGYQLNELLGQNHRIIKSGFAGPEFFANLWQTIAGGKVWHGEVRNRRKDGSFYWVAATIVPLLGTDGKPQQYIGIRTDITASKELEQSLKVATDKALAATQAKSQFLANMSHEIRTPMNAILGMLKLMEDTDMSVTQADYVSKAEGAAKSLLGLLNDILDFSKIDAGKMALDPQPFRVDKLLRDLAVILSANTGQKPVEVLFDLDPSTPRMLVGDALRLQQVLINLSGNAIKFTPKGEVVIQIRLVEQTDAGYRLRFAVRDSGIGIAPENQAHIFDGFSQAEASTTRRFGGTGLGLTISRRLVNLMGGDLQLESALGKGSTFHFTITLPAGNTAESAAPATPHGTNEPLDVLIVDDNPLAREVLNAMTTSWGWTAELAEDGEAAVERVRARLNAGVPVHQAVIMDWEMPGMDGWQTIARIRHLTPAGQAPITIMVTAHGREQLALRSEEEQTALNAYLIKPITPSMLFDAVANARSGKGNVRASVRTKVSKPKQLLGLRLLVVEDNVVNQQVAQGLLKAAGAHVELAANGRLGVQAVAAASPPFDAVLMDIQMPVMDGYAATQAIREELGLTDLPVIAMTANAMASDREACLAAGMNDHVGKPFDLPHLIHVLLTQTGRTNGASQPASALPSPTT